MKLCHRAYETAGSRGQNIANNVANNTSIAQGVTHNESVNTYLLPRAGIKPGLLAWEASALPLSQGEEKLRPWSDINDLLGANNDIYTLNEHG